MTKLTITREQQRQILIDTAKHIISRDNTSPYSENLREIARIAMAALDGEPVCLPLDYLQGHKDGLEWAAKLAEANHPDTGDWLYDDPSSWQKLFAKVQICRQRSQRRYVYPHSKNGVIALSRNLSAGCETP